jgi:hypothetical protein
MNFFSAQNYSTETISKVSQAISDAMLWKKQKNSRCDVLISVSEIQNLALDITLYVIDLDKRCPAIDRTFFTEYDLNSRIKQKFYVENFRFHLFKVKKFPPANLFSMCP